MLISALQRYNFSNRCYTLIKNSGTFFHKRSQGVTDFQYPAGKIRANPPGTEWKNPYFR